MVRWRAKKYSCILSNATKELSKQSSGITGPVAPKGMSLFEHRQPTTQGEQTAEFTWAERLRPVYLAHCWCYWDVLCTLLDVLLQLCAAPSESSSLLWVYHCDSLPRNLLAMFRRQPIRRASERASRLDGGGRWAGGEQWSFTVGLSVF